MVSPLAFAVANLLILWSGWTTDWKLGVAIVLGYAILTLNHVLHLNPGGRCSSCGRRCGCRST